MYDGIYDDIAIRYPSTAFDLDDKPDWVKQRIATWLN